MDVFKMYIEKLEPLYLGQQYESDVYIVEINMEQWMVAYPTITHYELFVTSPNGTVYPARTVFTGRTLTWMLTKEDTSVIGKGQYQILGLEAQGGYATKYSAIENIEIFPNMEGISDTTEVPEYAKSWAEEVARDAQMAAEAVEQIAGTAPYIGANGNWYTYFKSVNEYVDTGVSARGIKGDKGDKGDKGERGYTGATGPVGPQGEKGIKGDKGDKGDKGETGADGAKGDQGERGAKGDRGEKGEKGDPGYTPQKGVDYNDGKDGIDGRDGKDGYSPTVHLERIAGGVKITAQNKGEDPHSQVVNDGENGRDGEDGEDGFTPVVRLERVEGGVNITVTNKDEPDHSQVVNDGVIPPPEEYIPTMSETTKGGAKVGDGLEVVGGALRVKQAKSEILLSDSATGKVYSIHATNGEIIITESASASGAYGTITLVDTETQSSWSIYITNGELMIKEATA